MQREAYDGLSNWIVSSPENRDCGSKVGVSAKDGRMGWHWHWHRHRHRHRLRSGIGILVRTNALHYGSDWILE